MLKTEVDTSRGPVLYVCDRLCEKAWGVNGRRHDAGSSIEYDQDDDVVYLADGETGEAPRHPGTWEGGEGKPMHPERHNRWCMRECERCGVVEEGGRIVVPSFSSQVYNQPWRHPGVANPIGIDTGSMFTPKSSSS